MLYLSMKYLSSKMRGGEVGRIMIEKLEKYAKESSQNSEILEFL